MLHSYGYEYIPQDLLLEDYDGQNVGLVGFYERNGSRLSWWTRFFDYI